MIEWICRDQLQRRDLTDAMRRYLIGRQFLALKLFGTHYAASTPSSAGKRRMSPICAPKYESAPIRIRERLGKLYHIRQETVERYAAYTRALVESYHLRIASNKGPGCVCAISTIEYIYHRYGLNTLDRTLRLCVAAWEGEPDSLTANIIKGIALMITAYGDSLRDDLFQEKVGKFSAREISRSARERKMGSMGYAEVMLAAYNKKTRYPLRWSQLHELRSQRICTAEEDMSSMETQPASAQMSMDHS